MTARYRELCKHPKMHTGNPALSEKVVERISRRARAKQVKTMTVAGTAIKTLVLLVFLVAGGAWGWASATQSIPADIGSGYGNTTVTIPGGFWLASFAAFFVAMFLVFNPRRAALLGIVYALLRGLLPRRDLGRVQRADRRHRRARRCSRR